MHIGTEPTQKCRINFGGKPCEMINILTRNVENLTGTAFMFIYKLKINCLLLSPHGQNPLQTTARKESSSKMRNTGNCENLLS